MGVDIVVISTLDGIKTRMGGIVDGDDIEYGDIIGQEFVEAEKEFVAQRFCHIQVEKELAGMYLRVGAAAACDGAWGFEYFTERIFQHLLYINAIGMALPATVVCAMIGNMQKVPHY